ILHYSPFKTGWDWLTLILVLYTAVFTPFMAAFTDAAKTGESTAWIDFLNVVEVFVDIMFVADILINFRTTYVDDGEVIVNPRKIAINYMKGWFIIDAVAAVPFDWMLYGNGSSDALTQGLTGILKTARLLRLLRVARRIDQYSEYGAAVLILLMATFTLIAHWLACIFYALTTFERANFLNAPISWLDSLAKQHGITYHINGSEPDTKSRYITALYFTFTILTSVGFGNVAPVTNYEKVFTIFVMLLGSLMSAAIFGNVSSIMLRLYRGTEEYHEMLASIKEFIKFHYFPKPLADRLLESYQNTRSFTNGVDMNCVLKSFPDCLQADICLHLNRNLLDNSTSFRGASPGCLRALSLKLKSLHAPPGDTLIHPGDVLDSVYFITRGTIEILKEDIVVAIIAGKDDIFGENVKEKFFMSTKKAVNKSAYVVRAMSYADMHKIFLDDLYAIMLSYPDFASIFLQNFNVTFDIKQVG
ncbi:hypothetical protein HELRODRAFT_69639, partial [Helobdella robusta]|uniref:Cyclic nucleotide-binding domain-containing protein n=1 Tax=Helobdella robusta TaxID=6412 RepID=T1FZX6_HELRO